VVPEEAGGPSLAKVFFKTMREMGLITTLWQDQSAANAPGLNFIIFFN
jgi:hypothetical protein